MRINFAENIKLLRQKKGKNQTECGLELGLPRSTFSNYENGSTEPVVSKLMDIAQYFGISIEDLLFKDFKKSTVSVTKSSQKKKPATITISSPEKIIELQEATIKNLNDTVNDKTSIIALLTAEIEHLKRELQKCRQDIDGMAQPPAAKKVKKSA